VLTVRLNIWVICLCVTLAYCDQKPTRIQLLFCCERKLRNHIGQLLGREYGSLHRKEYFPGYKIFYFRLTVMLRQRPAPGWKLRPGRSATSRLRTMENDLKPLNLGRGAKHPTELTGMMKLSAPLRSLEYANEWMNVLLICRCKFGFAFSHGRPTQHSLSSCAQFTSQQRQRTVIMSEQSRRRGDTRIGRPCPASVHATSRNANNLTTPVRIGRHSASRGTSSAIRRWSCIAITNAAHRTTSSVPTLLHSSTNALYYNHYYYSPTTATTTTTTTIRFDIRYIYVRSKADGRASLI